MLEHREKPSLERWDQRSESWDQRSESWDQRSEIRDQTKLEELGSTWDPLAAAWEEKLAELAAYKAMPGHGHCNVPNFANARADSLLGKWVRAQRKQKIKYDADPAASSLTAERVAKLEELGFAWNPLAAV